MIENFVDAILSNLMELMPFVIINTSEKGCRWTLGRNPHPLEAGIHWRIWLLQQVQVINVADEVMNITTQSVMTKDEKLVCFRTAIGFRVKDPVKHANNVYDFVESTATTAMQHLAKRVREKSLVELNADLGKLEKSLETTLETKFKDWGTEVFSVGFTDFAEVPTQIRLFHDGIPAFNK